MIERIVSAQREELEQEIGEVETEAALAGFPVIEPAHFWIGVCKAVDGFRHKIQDSRFKRRGREMDGPQRRRRWRF